MESTVLTDPVLETRIPEWYRVEGLEYGAYVGQRAKGWTGYYVRPKGTGRWGVARQTPAGDEVHETDAEIVEAIREELTRA